MNPFDAMQVAESMVLSPRQKVYQLDTSTQKSLLIFKMCFLCPWKQKGMRYMILKGKSQKKHSSLSSKLIQIRDDPKLLADVSSPQTSGNPRKPIRKIAVFFWEARCDYLQFNDQRLCQGELGLDGW